MSSAVQAMHRRLRLADPGQKSSLFPSAPFLAKRIEPILLLAGEHNVRKKVQLAHTLKLQENISAIHIIHEDRVLTHDPTSTANYQDLRCCLWGCGSCRADIYQGRGTCPHLQPKQAKQGT
jgi:hypothetical protein